MLAFRVRLLSGKAFLQAKKTPLVVSGTQTQVLVDSKRAKPLRHLDLKEYICNTKNLDLHI